MTSDRATPTGDQTGVAARGERGGVLYEQRDGGCTFRVKEGYAIAPGRIWGTLLCPKATNAAAATACAMRAELRFENCREE